MIVNDKMLSIPPYISTGWNAVNSLHLKGNLLVVSLKDDEIVHIPGIEHAQLLEIFAAHASYLEKKPSQSSSQQNTFPSHLQRIPFLFGAVEEDSADFGNSDSSLRMSFGALDQFSGALQHNSQQSHAPDLPKEMLNKFSAIARIVAPNDPQMLPQAEPHCNCFHCQIARAIQNGANNDLDFEKEEDAYQTVEEDTEDNIASDELAFQQWNIIQTGDNLYSVENKLDSFEKYNVFLGNPVGCTCGKTGCEHLLAVLKS